MVTLNWFLLEPTQTVTGVAGDADWSALSGCRCSVESVEGRCGDGISLGPGTKSLVMFNTAVVRHIYILYTLIRDSE